MPGYSDLVHSRMVVFGMSLELAGRDRAKTRARRAMGIGDCEPGTVKNRIETSDGVRTSE